MDVKIKVATLYHCRALLLGYVGVKNVTGETFEIPPFLNVTGITEGVRRKATKISKKVSAEITSLDEQRAKINDEKVEGEFENDDEKKKAEDALNESKVKRDFEILDDEVTLTIEEPIDFSKIEDVKFDYNYTPIFEHFAINY